MTKQKFRPLEKNFEDHFCERLEVQGYRKRANDNFDFEDYLDFKILEEFLEKTQKEELREIIEEYGDRWEKEFRKRVREELKEKKLFEILRDGINISNQNLKLIYFKPETTLNKQQLEKYDSNIFSYIRQFKFIDDEKLDSIDIVLYVNGFPIVTIELKSQMNGQVVEDAVSQYISRDKKYKIFRTPFLHIASDTSQVKIVSEFIENNADEFVWFNKDIENPIVDNEFRTEYLYNDVLTPDSIAEIIEHYLNCFEREVDDKKIRTFFFPRYHQRRTVQKLFNDISKKYERKKKLDLKYLIQHSAGSGKSYTIAVLQKFLRYLHVKNQPVFDSVIILTDRKNLDSQIKGTISSGENQQQMVSYVENTSELAKSLNKGIKVIVTTIQKFSVKKLDEMLKKQKSKKLCLIIDEAHRSQTGKLHKNMVSTLEKGLDEEIADEFSKKKFPNMCFIALTATPSDKTLQMFGKEFDLYSMEQAEKEGYILPVSENITTYQTLFELSSEIKDDSEYPPLLVVKKIKNKAYEDKAVIKNKIDIILKIFEDKTKRAILGDSAKAMIVTSSRKAAAKYKLLLDEELKRRKLSYKTLVAFTGPVNVDGKDYTEKSLNGKLKEKEIPKEFKKKEYRFIIVANKYQTGFNEPLLHTMFLDKSLSGINAVQTISRLNRIYSGKLDTLTIDFTNSYKEIIKAFKKFKLSVEDFSNAEISDLPKIQQELFSYNIFTLKDIDNFKKAFSEANQMKIDNIFSEIDQNLKKKFDKDDQRKIRSKLNRFSKLFSYLDNLVRIEEQGIKDFSLFTYYLFKYLNPLGTGKKIDEELKKVFIKRHKIKQVEDSLIDEVSRIVSVGKKEFHYATIKEVIEAINLKFKLALTDQEETAIQNYMDDIVNDLEIRREIEANQNIPPEKLFEMSLRDKLYEKFLNYFAHYNIEKVGSYIEKGLESFINKSVFNILVDKIKKKREDETGGLEVVF